MAPRTATTLGSVDVEADDPAALAGFWAGLLGTTIAGQHQGHGFLAPRPEGGFAMFFQPRNGPRAARQGQHLDLDRAVAVPGRGGRAGLGARGHPPLGRPRRGAWVRWSTLADPGGDLFCIAEHPPTRVDGS